MTTNNLIENKRPSEGFHLAKSPRTCQSYLSSWFVPGTLSSSTISMLGCILSAGAVCTPYAFSLVGVIPGVIMMFCGFWLSLYTCKLMFKCSNYGMNGEKLYSYEALSYRLGGDWFLGVINVFMYVMCIGFQVSYVVMVSTMCSQIATEMKWVSKRSMWGDENAFRIYAALIQFGVIFPVSLLKRIKDFLAITWVQCLTIVYVIVAIVVASILWDGEYAEKSEKYMDMDMDLHTRLSLVKLYSTSLKDYLEAFPYVVFAFAGQPWVLSIYEGLENPNIIRINKVMDRTLWFILIILTLCSFFGYLLFLDITKTNILLHDFKTHYYAGVAIVIILVGVVFNMPYNMVPMRNVLIKMTTGKDMDQIDSVSCITIFFTSLISSILCYAFSVITSDVGDVISVFGATLNVFMCYMMPCIFYMMIQTKIENYSLCHWKNWIPMFVMLLSFVLGCISLTMFIMDKYGML